MTTQALYRMCEVQGTVLIDGTDTSTQTLSELRGSISVIPQVLSGDITFALVLFFDS